jgi:hypothetical protein
MCVKGVHVLGHYGIGLPIPMGYFVKACGPGIALKRFKTGGIHLSKLKIFFIENLPHPEKTLDR